MSTYAIGDIQGCFNAFQSLLAKIQFKPEEDQLWLVGDLVNRGPNSLEVLRYLRDLPRAPIIVLGNHDLHLLAVACGAEPVKKKDTFQDVLAAPDCDALCHWLRQQKLFHHDASQGYVLVHAGLPPQWNLSDALKHAAEAEAILQGPSYKTFFQHMYGDEPDCWQDTLVGWPRMRLITNYFTRMRFCTPQGRWNLRGKRDLKEQPKGFLPWFKIPNHQEASLKIIFGHWAALEGKTEMENRIALDTGCVWGGKLTAFRLEDGKFFRVKSS